MSLQGLSSSTGKKILEAINEREKETTREKQTAVIEVPVRCECYYLNALWVSRRCLDLRLATTSYLSMKAVELEST